MTPERVLVLCTANRIRSVLFAALLVRHLDGSGWSDRVAVSSAGLLQSGVPPEPEALTAAASLGLDVRDHRSRHLDRHLVDDADLVLGAERSHVAEVWALRHKALTRTFTYNELAGFAEATGPRHEGEKLHAYLHRAAGASAPRDVRGVMGAPETLDVADPVGRPTAVVLSIAAHLDRTSASIGAAVWPAGRPTA